MSRDLNLLFAGFGGQGVLFAGKLVAYAGLVEGRELSWLPSYGPEMRGGTANCSVCLSDEPIGSPQVVQPDVLVAMNQPSLDKFFADVVPGGVVIVDSGLVPNVPERDDVKVFRIPATEIAEENGLKGLGNVILVGKVFEETGFCERESLEQAIRKSVSAKRQNLVEANIKAIEIGMQS